MKSFQNTAIAIVLAIFSMQASATPVSGHVADAKTGEAIIGASVIYNNKVGAVTDADGHFHLDIAAFPTQIIVSYVGYENQQVSIANVSFSADWQPLKQLRLTAKGAYSLGRDDGGDGLPLIAPLTYLSRLTYTTGRLGVTAELRGHARQSEYGEKYGETPAAAWTIINLSAVGQFSAGSLQFSVRAGIENLTDRHYATYADWCHIPQKGRNIYINLTFEL